MKIEFENFMENIKDWPLFVKVCFGIIFSALVVAGAVELPQLGQQQTVEDTKISNDEIELVNVDILVFSDKNTTQPIENASVTFLSQSSPVKKKTDSNGFTQVDIPKRDDIDIIIVKDGFKEARYTINLDNDPERSKQYYLIPE